MKTKKKYEHSINGLTVATREAARIIQRALRDPVTGTAPRIMQKLTIERVVR